MIAWRDLDDPEAGGSEVHAAHIAKAWAEAGIDVTMRTSRAAGHPKFGMRDGYRTVRKSGRYSVFGRTAASGLLGRTGSGDGLVEIWNGMPFFSPVWSRCPSIVLLHHVHAEMWRMVLKPAALARVGELIEFRVGAALLPQVAHPHPVAVLEARDRRAARHPRRPRRRRPPGHLAVVLARRRTVTTPAGRRRRPARAGQAVPPARRRPGRPPAPSPHARGGDRRRGVRAGRARGADPRRRRRVVAAPAGAGRRRRAARPVPAGVGARVDVAARGLGHDDHRGGGVRDARGGHRHRRSPRRDQPRRVGPARTGRVRQGAHRRPRRRAARRPVPRAAFRGCHRARVAVHVGGVGTRHAPGALRGGAAPPPAGRRCRTSRRSEIHRPRRGCA